MRLEVEMYVRLDRNQGIAKIDEYDEEYNCFSLDKCICDSWGDETFYLDEEDVLKASHNITKILKVKDVITIFSDLHDSLGKQTLFIENANHLKHIKIGLENGYYHLIDVLTKEQFEEMKYKI